MRRGIVPTRLVMPLAALVMGLTAAPSSGQSELDYRTGSLSNDEPQAIYSADPSDAWNRIFHALFTRTLRVRLSKEFAGAAPFGGDEALGFPDLPVSTRTFERIEGGDRAIEPLYPLQAHIDARGASRVLNESRLDQLTRGLKEALEEERPRSPLARALMQSDLWAAHDAISPSFAASRPSEGVGRERIGQTLSLLARAVKKLALTPREIEALPDNFARARLPFDLFGPDGGWMEVEYLPDRIHDEAADDRRAARIFLKPSAPPRDRRKWLDGLPRDFGQLATSQLDAVALVVQLLLIDTNGVVVPTRLTYEVQLRTFLKGAGGALKETKLAVAELSRRALILDPQSGGLLPVEERSPIYLPTAGNDYTFASPRRDEPILAPLRKRCQFCHAEDVKVILTFAVHLPDPPAPVRLLNRADNEHALYVARRKMQRPDFRELRRRYR